ncbi:MAG: glycosyl hydrolase family 18 protein, partial [Bacillota bacterium]
MLKRIAAALMVIALTTLSSVGVASMPTSTPPSERINMTYLHLGTPAQQLQYIDRTKGALDIVAPSYFDLNADGSLLFNSSKYQASFVEEMHRRGIKVVPYLSNHWDQNAGRVALTNRELLTTQIAEAIKKYQLDGVNVDIENLTEVDRDNYTDLVRLLRTKLPDKQVSVAVPANPKRRTTGWVGCYDNAKLSEYADYLMLMAYDESYRGSPERPVASIQFVEGAIQTILDEGVSPAKVVLGISFYGRIWGGDGSMIGDGL